MERLPEKELVSGGLQEAGQMKSNSKVRKLNGCVRKKK